MMLFEIIRDWFVVNIWGGSTSQGDLYSFAIGRIFAEDGIIDGGATTGATYFGIGEVVDLDVGDTLSHKTFMPLGDWLSTTSTIIVMVALCFFFFLMVRWLFRLTSGLMQGRG